MSHKHQQKIPGQAFFTMSLGHMLEGLLSRQKYLLGHRPFFSLCLFYIITTEVTFFHNHPNQAINARLFGLLYNASKESFHTRGMNRGWSDDVSSSELVTTRKT